MEDVFQHQLVPQHRKLSEEEAKDVLTHYTVSKEQLPQIMTKDVALENLDAQEGDVIEITRMNAHGEEHMYYRVVVEGKVQ